MGRTNNDPYGLLTNPSFNYEGELDKENCIIVKAYGNVQRKNKAENKETNSER